MTCFISSVSNSNIVNNGYTTKHLTNLISGYGATTNSTTLLNGCAINNSLSSSTTFINNNVSAIIKIS